MSLLQEPEARKGSAHSSKMRLHKGNIPSMPQSKLCPMCPAKFTRTTHLNRHLRTHSDERLYQCDTCHSQFTRSDLLTRHKRTCGDPETTIRSRRRSCQACAESKVKCDLQQPCSKCKSRSRECIYVAGTRRTDYPPRQHEAVPAKEGSPATSASEPSSSNSCSGLPTPRCQSDHGSLRTDFSTPSPIAQDWPELRIHTAEPPSNIVNFSIDKSSTFSKIDGIPSGTQSHMSNLLSNEIFDGLLGGIFTPNQQQSPAHVDFVADVVDAKEACRWPHFFDHGSGPSLLSAEPEDFDSSLKSLSMQDPLCPREPSGVPVSDTTVGACDGPSSTELQHYRTLFFTAFLKKMPIVHAATFHVEDKPPILLAAMRACGALYVRTRVAINFVDATLSSVRDELVSEFTKDPTDSEYQTHLALAVAFLQTIGLFHQLSEQRVYSTVYHGMLIMLIRMSGFVQRCARWVPPDMGHLTSIDVPWREWVMHETAKRALLLCYVHDCVHCLYYSLHPTFPSLEFDLGLPCEDALWTARTADEWLSILRKPSLYGSTTDRLCGFSLQAAFMKLADSSPTLSPPPMLNPFAHWILIHSILRKLFEDFLEPLQEAGVADCTSHGSHVPPTSDQKVFATQLMLHHWLQSWLHSPDTPKNSEVEDSPFVFQGLPFYWMGQVAILAYQERLPPFGPGTTSLISGDAKFLLMKKWERHIRRFLRKGEQEPTLLMYELMNIRINSWQAETVGGDTGQDEAETVHLLGFFPET
ncbi:fungal-specific transcription factor domain-containing protein [Sparassis latifolia]